VIAARRLPRSTPTCAGTPSCASPRRTELRSSIVPAAGAQHRPELIESSGRGRPVTIAIPAKPAAAVQLKAQPVQGSQHDQEHCQARDRDGHEEQHRHAWLTQPAASTFPGPPCLAALPRVSSGRIPPPGPRHPLAPTDGRPDAVATPRLHAPHTTPSRRSASGNVDIWRHTVRRGESGRTPAEPPICTVGGCSAISRQGALIRSLCVRDRICRSPCTVNGRVLSARSRPRAVTALQQPPRLRAR
jgi:hypothetical protein